MPQIQEDITNCMWFLHVCTHTHTPPEGTAALPPAALGVPQQGWRWREEILPEVSADQAMEEENTLSIIPGEHQGNTPNAPREWLQYISHCMHMVCCDLHG